MPTMPRQRTQQTRRAGRPAARGSSGRAGTIRRTQQTQRRTPSLRRSKPKQSGVQQAVSKVGGMLGGGSKAASSAKKPAGLALMAGAAGLALKNRDKLGGMFGKGGEEQQPTQPESHAPAHPAADEQGDERFARPPGAVPGDPQGTPPAI